MVLSSRWKQVLLYAYALNNLQSRGRFFIAPGDEVYAGQVVGEHTKDNDLVVNVTKSKKLTNMRASGSDDKVSLAPPTVFSLEDALEYIKGDEYVEITPNSMRMRKIILDELERKRQEDKSYHNIIAPIMQIILGLALSAFYFNSKYMHY